MKTKLKVNYTPDAVYKKKAAAETTNKQIQTSRLHCRSVLDHPTELGVPTTDINRIRISRSDMDVGRTQISRSDIVRTRVGISCQAHSGTGIGTGHSNNFWQFCINSIYKAQRTHAL